MATAALWHVDAEAISLDPTGQLVVPAWPTTYAANTSNVAKRIGEF